jgi:hypothetical protein
VGALLGHRLAQDGQRAQLGTAYADHGLVFAEADGNPWHPNHVTKTFTTITRDAGLRRIRLHDLRHGRASLMLAAGVDIAVVSKVLGHASIRTTADTYSHLLEGVGQRAAEAADALIVRQPRDQSVTNQAGETVEAPFGDDRKEPLTCGDDGGAEGTRTPDPLHAMQMRYQLRHSPGPLPAGPAGNSRNPSQPVRRLRNRVRAGNPPPSRCTT